MWGLPASPGLRLTWIIDAPSQCLGIQVIEVALADPSVGGNLY
jgi:hypothetical protein